MIYGSQPILYLETKQYNQFCIKQHYVAVKFSVTAKEVDTVARADIISATAITKRRECMKAKNMLLDKYPPNC